MKSAKCQNNLYHRRDGGLTIGYHHMSNFQRDMMLISESAFTFSGEILDIGFRWGTKRLRMLLTGELGPRVSADIASNQEVKMRV